MFIIFSIDRVQISLISDTDNKKCNGFSITFKNHDELCRLKTFRKIKYLQNNNN